MSDNDIREAATAPGPIPHPAPAEPPAFMKRSEQGAPTPTPTSAGLGLVGRLKALLHRGERPPAPLPVPDEDGTYELKAKSAIQALPRLRGQREGTSYCLVAEGLPLPPGSAAYLVSFGSSESFLEKAVPARGIPGVLRTTVPGRVRVVALIDEYGRAFTCDTLASMPPARHPEVQLKRYPSDLARGCIDVSVGPSKVIRAAEYAEGPDGIDIVNARADLGGKVAGLSLCAACGAAYLALWAFPRRDGYSLASVGIRDVAARMRSTDVFEATSAIVDAVDDAATCSLVVVPGILSYFAQTLREAGLDSVKAADLAAAGKGGPGPDGVPFMPGMVLPGLGGPASSQQSAAQVMRGIAELIGSALAARGIPGLTVLGPGDQAPGRPGANAPKIRLMRTAKYSNSFFVVFDREEVSAEGARILLEAESVLNRFVMALEADPEGLLQVAGEADAAALDRWVVDRAGAAGWPYLDGKVEKVRPAAEGDADLGVRMAFSRGCECLRLPYRLEYTFRYDASSGSLIVEFECPSSAIMPRVGWNAREVAWEPLSYEAREAMATRYAAFSLVAVAAVAFWAGKGVRRVVANGWRGLGAARGVDELVKSAEPRRGALMPGEPACILTAEFERERFYEAFSNESRRRDFERDPFGHISGVRHAFGMDRLFHLTPVRPLATLEDAPYRAAAPALEPELDQRRLSEGGRALLGASIVEELAVYEGVRRREEARGIMDAYASEGHLAALAVARDACARTENPLVKAAFDRVNEGIATDAITAESSEEVNAILGDIYGLQARMEHASSVVQKDPAEARRIVEEMVAVADSNGWFQDSRTRKFRYFDSYASRMVYALRCEERGDGRDLRLCADDYYMAHYRASALLDDTIEGGEDAISHALRCVELAPAVASAHMRLARCYFGVFDYASEIEAIKCAVKVAWNPKDMGVALYWLGYAFCMTDRLDAGMACYQCCVSYDRALAEPAAAEAAEVLKKRGLEPRTLTDREARMAVEAAGVDLSSFEENVEFLVKAAGAVQEAGNSGLASNLLSAAGIWLRDDAIPPVIESLEG